MEWSAVKDIIFFVFIVLGCGFSWRAGFRCSHLLMREEYEKRLIAAVKELNRLAIEKDNADVRKNDQIG